MSPTSGPPETELVEISYRDAMHDAIREAMAADPRVFLMGEDVADYGGTYAVSKGLYEEFGRDRVRNTPLSESGFVGAGIGAAIGGMRPIVEVMTVNFSLLALDQLVNTAATFLHMTGGQVNVPVVVRMATGAGRQLAAQHSHSLEGWFAHVPGLRIVTPGTVDDARWMLATALDDPDPVLIFEHAAMYNARGVLTSGGPVDIDTGRILRAGTDLSLMTYGGSVPKALAAADELADDGVDVEVIDLRTLRPLDTPLLAQSVMKTRRGLVVDEGWRSGGISAEISARLTEVCFGTLAAPIGRVCGAEVPIPYALHLEQAAVPQVPDIVFGAREVLAHG